MFRLRTRPNLPLPSQPVSRPVGQPIIQSLKIDEIDTRARRRPRASEGRNAFGREGGQGRLKTALSARADHTLRLTNVGGPALRERERATIMSVAVGHLKDRRRPTGIDIPHRVVLASCVRPVSKGRGGIRDIIISHSKVCSNSVQQTKNLGQPVQPTNPPFAFVTLSWTLQN